MSSGVNHYGTCTGGGSNSHVGSGGGSHQRDSGHASIGSSEDLAPAPPLPPRYDHSIEWVFCQGMSSINSPYIQPVHVTGRQRKRFIHPFITKSVEKSLEQVTF